MTVIALAASPERKSRTEALREGKVVSNAAVKAAATQRAVYETAYQDAVAYINLVLSNNPGREAVVARRPDVAEMIRRASRAAEQVAVLNVEKAWARGSQVGDRAAKKYIKIFDLPAPKAQKVADPDSLNTLKSDLRRIHQDAQSAFERAILTRDAQNAVAHLALRASMVSEAAVKEAARDAQIRAMRGTGTKAKWQTRSPVPCSHCRELNGMVRSWGLAFPDAVEGLRPLGTHGPLLGPPRHPNCRCVLVPVKE